MRRVHIKGVPIPEMYAVKSGSREVGDAIALGIPFVVWDGSDEDLVKLILLRACQKLFPSIDWYKVLNIKSYTRPVVIVPGGKIDYGERELTEDDINDNGVHDSAETWREFNGTCNGNQHLDIDDFVGDLDNYVNVEKLDELNMLPSFISDITATITNEPYGNMWTEGYNKKRKAMLGNFLAKPEDKNLIILDVSGSIPGGIAATMISLIDTLRHRAHADLIITSSTSKFYPFGEELPSPKQIRAEFGWANESWRFFEILKSLNGAEYSNVISFGDYDSPGEEFNKDFEITVHNVWHYHTRHKDKTGYALWCKPRGTEYFDNTWCNVVTR